MDGGLTTALATLAAALLLDTFYGEYPPSCHPVVWIGKAVSLLLKVAPQNGWWRPLIFGVFLASVVPALAVAATLAVLRLASPALGLGFFVGVFLLKASFALRELGIADQPRKLLKSVRGLDLVEMADSDRCCGFGGTFAVKYGEISTAIVDEKIANIEACGASVLVASDLGCLMHIAGRLAREGRAVEVRHFAEVLAGITEAPAICAGRPKRSPEPSA